MNNIPQDKLQKYVVTGNEAVKHYNEFVKWTNSYLEGDDRALTNYNIKKCRRGSNNILKVFTKKPVIALFGKSQVGKSYLVDNILATDTEKKLQIPDYSDNGKPYFFIGDINPEGGKESTGVVSRFSIEKSLHQSNYPIEIKLLTARDVILILCDSFFSDIKYYENPEGISKNEITDFLSGISSFCSTTTQTVLTDDDIYDIQDYLEKYFKDKTVLLNFKDAKFWDIIANSIIKIQPEKWVNIFELLWGKIERFSNLFNTLINELRKLDFSEIVFAEFSSLLREKGSILDVERVFELENDPNSPVNIAFGNKNANVSRSKLAALTYEVIIPIKGDLADAQKGGKEFLKNVDILDFPGARNRETDHEKDVPNLSIRDFYNYYRRGKVAYLFNKYTENFEINSLLFCIDNEPLEVKNLAFLLKNWIDYYIGERIEERTDNLKKFTDAASNIISPLFIIFTKANIMLQYKDTDDSGKFDYKWKTRFENLFAFEYCKGYDWYKNWVYKGNNIENFKNMYMLRSFKWAEGIYEGYAENGTENKISDFRKDYMNGLRNSFVNLDFNKNHLRDPERAWREFTDLNKDGSDYIIENITPIANNQIRTERYKNKLREFKEKIEAEIKKHYHSDEANEKIETAKQESIRVVTDMDWYFHQRKFEFGNFISHLILSEAELRDRLRDFMRKDWEEEEKLFKYEGIRNRAGIKLQEFKDDEEKVLLFNENMARLKEKHGDNVEADLLKNYPGFNFEHCFFGGKSDYKKQSDALAERARDFWFENKLDVKNFQYFINLGLNSENLKKLLDNLKISFNRLDIVGKIGERIRTYVDDFSRNQAADDMIAHIIVSTINEFVNTVGWKDYREEQKKKIIDSNKTNKLDLKIPDDVDIFESINKVNDDEKRMSVEKLIDLMSENPEKNEDAKKYVPFLMNFEKWTELLRISFIANCDIPNYDRIANQELKVIKEKIRLIDFSI